MPCASASAPQAVVLGRRESPALAGRPEMLFVSPVLPNDSGNGLAMRAALFLRAVCRHWSVRLLVLDLFGGVAFGHGWPEATEACAEVVIVRPSPDPLFAFIGTLRDPAYRAAALLGYPLPQLARFATPASVAAALACIGHREFARVHVFRLYLAPFIEPLLGRTQSSLDLDDDDARTARSLASLLAATGRGDEAALQQAEGRKWASFAADWLPRFDLVSFASPGDADRAARSAPGPQIACIPNAVEPPKPLGTPPADGPGTLLFVGSMGYLPNRDAATLLARDVLPAVRRCCAKPVRLILAGGTDPELQSLARPGEIELAGRVEDLRPLYAASHVVLAPLRAGGGTRIKVLEAMAHARPVVATALGAEGLDVESGVHVLLGEDGEALAEATCRILNRPELGAALAARGRALVLERYTRTTVMRRIQALLGTS